MRILAVKRPLQTTCPCNHSSELLANQAEASSLLQRPESRDNELHNVIRKLVGQRRWHLPRSLHWPAPLDRPADESLLQSLRQSRWNGGEEEGGLWSQWRSWKHTFLVYVFNGAY